MATYHNHDDAERAEVAKRRAQVVAMRRAGVTFQQIADQIEHFHGSKSMVYEDVQRAYADAKQECAESVELLVQQEDERDDDLRRRLNGILAGTYYVVQGGQIVLGLDGKPLRDVMPILQAIDRLDRLANRYAVRHGLNKPERIELALDRRTDLESMAVVEAILAGFAAVELPAELRLTALEAARRSLETVDGEVVSESEG